MSLNCDDFIVEHNKAYQQGREDAINTYKQSEEYIRECVQRYIKGRADGINAIKNDLHKRLTEEMNKPYQDQSLCQGLYFGIQRCDWYLNDGKEQNDAEN